VRKFENEDRRTEPVSAKLSYKMSILSEAPPGILRLERGGKIIFKTRDGEYLDTLGRFVILGLLAKEPCRRILFSGEDDGRPGSN